MIRDRRSCDDCKILNSAPGLLQATVSMKITFRKITATAE